MPTQIENSFANLRTALTGRLAKKVPSVSNSDNASTIASKNAAAISTDNAVSLTTHVNDKTNPHGVTAAQVGTLIKSDAVAKFANGPDCTALGIQYYGDNTDAGVPFTINGNTLTVLAGVPVLMGSTPGVLGEFTANLTTWDNTYFLYVRLTNGVYSYALSQGAAYSYNQVAESDTNMCVGCFTTGPTGGIVRYNLLKRRRLGRVPINNDGYPVTKFSAGSCGMNDLTYRSVHGLFKNNKQQIFTGRGFTVVAFSNGEVSRVGYFDTYGDTTASARMLAFVNAIPSGTSVLVHTWDAFTGNITADSLTALNKIGVDTTDFMAKVHFRSAFLALGRKDGAVGSSYYGYDGLVDNDSNASIVVKFNQDNIYGFRDVEVVKAGSTMVNF